LEPLFLDLIEDFPHGKGCVEDALPQRRHGLRMQGLFTAHRDHVSIGSDRPEQTVELVDLVDGDSENKAFVRHGVPPFFRSPIQQRLASNWHSRSRSLHQHLSGGIKETAVFPVNDPTLMQSKKLCTII
jgi:hypothetical protein